MQPSHRPSSAVLPPRKESVKLTLCQPRKPSPSARAAHNSEERACSVAYRVASTASIPLGDDDSEGEGL